MTERRSKREAAVDEPVASAEESVGAPEALEEQPVAEAEVAEAQAPVAETADQAVAVDAAAESVVADVATADDAPTAEAAADAGEPVAEVGEPIAAAVTEPANAPIAGPAPERQPKSREPKTEPEAPAPPPGPRGLQLRYRTDVIPALVKQFEYANPNQVPRLQKIVVNIGLGEALTNAKAIDAASSDLTMITGQKPIVMKARRSIAQFKIRTGNPIGLKVTLRGQRMWDFLERMTMLALPRIRDFRGTPGRSFDGRGNYTLGLREQIAFPEIDYDKVDRLRGLEVSIVTTAKSDEESKRLLELLGMPFAS
jgi:large subunit ribosomal protein L5